MLDLSPSPQTSKVFIHLDFLHFINKAVSVRRSEETGQRTAHCHCLLQSCRQRAWLLFSPAKHYSTQGRYPQLGLVCIGSSGSFLGWREMQNDNWVLKLSAGENKRPRLGRSAGADLTAQERSQLHHASLPVEVLLHHSCHGSGNSSFMWTKVFI